MGTPILSKRDALRADLIRMHEGLTATLRIGVIPTAMPVTALLAGAFQTRNPLARVQVEMASSREILHRLAEFDLDAGVAYLDGEALTGVNGRESCPWSSPHVGDRTAGNGLRPATRSSASSHRSPSGVWQRDGVRLAATMLTYGSHPTHKQPMWSPHLDQLKSDRAGGVDT
ncbi:hypothetical protein GCM10009609_65560 [Pseudonocardia aurantiaca]|uniref:LysR substrate-binding domain-containing protein n=1 Tax=Pseudonocardia aurantiaca TaxID=75290 RepID=A0ABW4FU45_9PSEU